MSERSKVVITGFEAKFYDELLDILTLGQYPKFIKNVIFQETETEPGNTVAELGVGNGRNAILFAKKIGEKGKVIGFDISDDMIEKAKKKTKKYPNIEIVKHNILQPFPQRFENFFDLAFISFVFHGLEDYEKDQLLSNLQRILKKGAKFYILDYNQTELAKTPWYFRYFMTHLECPLAVEYLNYPLEEELARFGFKHIKSFYHFKNLIKYSWFEYEA